MLVVIAIIAIPKIINQHEYKNSITKFISEKIGREFNINGDIELSLFPHLSLSCKQADLANANNFKFEKFAKIESIEASLAILPLIYKKIVINELNINGLQLFLEKNKLNKVNYDFNIKKTTKTADKNPIDISIQNININDTKITWNNKIQNTNYIFSKLNFYADELNYTDFLKLNKVSLNFIYNNQEHKINIPYLNLDQQAINIKNITFNSPSFNLTANVNNSIDNKINGNLNVAEFNLQNLLKNYNLPVIKTSDNKALNKLSFKTNFSFDGDKILKLHELNLFVDESKMQGWLQIINFKQPQFDFNLNANKLNLDNYLPPEETSKKDKPNKIPENIKLPLEFLRNLSLKGVLKVDEFEIKKLKMQNIELNIQAKDGKLKTTQTMDLYQGKYYGKTQLNTNNNPPNLYINSKIQQIQMSQLLSDFKGYGRVDGLSDIQVDLYAYLPKNQTLKKNINGKIKVLIKNGAFNDTDLRYKIRQVKALLSGKKSPKKPEIAKLKFSQLSSNFTLQNNILHTDDLYLEASKFDINGDGDFNIESKEVMYNLLLVTTDDKVRSSEIPMKLSGKLPKLSIKLDTSALKKATKQQIEDRLKNEFKQRAKEKLLDWLRN
jgi:AsmA protein